jgi:hypothetical protein
MDLVHLSGGLLVKKVVIKFVATGFGYIFFTK